jgi:hypothetical protein
MVSVGQKLAVSNPKPLADHQFAQVFGEIHPQRMFCNCQDTASGVG